MKLNWIGYLAIGGAVSFLGYMGYDAFSGGPPSDHSAVIDSLLKLLAMTAMGAGGILFLMGLFKFTQLKKAANFERKNVGREVRREREKLWSDNKR